MAKVQTISTDGYRGPLSEFQYIPPGEYLVGAKTDVAAQTLARKLAEYMVSIDKAQIVAVTEGDEPVTETTTTATTSEVEANLNDVSPAQPEAANEPAAIPDRAELNDMPWEAVRELAETHGFEYTNKKEVIDALLHLREIRTGQKDDEASE